MADTKISDLPAATSVDGTEPLPIVQAATTKKSAISLIKDYIVATANVFTKAQTFQPDSDAQAGTFRRNASGQTANIVEIQTESNAVLASIDKTGAVTTPTANLGTAGTTTGTLKLSGSTSGTVTVQPAAAAGTYTLTLPTNDGDAGQFLKTNGTGTLSWDAAGGGGSPGGSNTQVQFNDGGSFGGDAGLVFNKTTNVLTAGAVVLDPEDNTAAIAASGYALSGSNATSLVDLAGTWNTTGTPTALKLNVTDTASNAASLLLDLQVGGVTLIAARKDGRLTVGNPSASNPGVLSFQYGTGRGVATANGTPVFAVSDAGYLTLASVGFTSNLSNTTPDTFLARDATDTLAQRRTTNAQTFRVYRSFTDASNYSRVSLGWSSSTAILATEGAGTGARGNIAFGSAALATSATVGYLMIPTSNGAPTGVPADIPTGQVALHYDTANNKIYVYNGGWVSTAALT